jgi:hypothetical protein
LEKHASPSPSSLREEGRKEEGKVEVVDQPEQQDEVPAPEEDSPPAVKRMHTDWGSRRTGPGGCQGSCA